MNQKVLAEMRKLEAGKGFKTKLFPFGLALSAFETLSGVYLFFVENMNIADMVILLGHIAGGFIFIVPCVMMYDRNKLYSQFFEKKRYKVVGVVTVIGLFFAFVTGAYLTFAGKPGNYWLWLLHALGSTLAAGILALYCLIILKFFFANLPEKAKRGFAKVIARISKKVVYAAVVLIVGIPLTKFLYPKFISERDKDAYTFDYKLGNKNPFFPGKTQTASGGHYKNEAFANSRSCGTTGCHEATFRQFEASTHFRQPNIVVSKVQKLLVQHWEDDNMLKHLDHIPHFDKIKRATPGRQTFRFCSSCHAPVANITGAVDPSNPFETYMKHEGASCTYCHSLKNPNAGPGNHLITAPQNRYLFHDSTNPIGQFIHYTLVNAKPESHKNMFMLPVYKKSRACLSCHFTNHYSSWEEEDFYNPKKMEEKVTQCQSCHMKQVAVHDDVSAIEKGTIADHRFIAANYALAQYYGHERQYNKTVEFLKDKKIDIEILPRPAIAKSGEFKLGVRMSNIGVGHNFPAGPEGDIVQSWPEIKIFNDKDELVYHYGHLEKNNHLDENKFFVFYILPLDLYENPIELRQHPSWKFVYDVWLILPARGYQDLVLDVKIPKQKLTENLRVEAKMNFRKPNQRFADWVFGPGVYTVPVVVMDQDNKEIQVVSDANLIAEADQQLNHELANPTGIVKELGLKKNNRAKPEKIFRFGVENLIMLGNMEQAIEDGRLRLAKKIYQSFTKDAQNHKKVIRARKQLLQAIKKSREQSAKQRIQKRSNPDQDQS